MSGLGCRTRLAFGTRRRNFAKASLGSFKVNPRLRLGLTLNSPRLALYENVLLQPFHVTPTPVPPAFFSGDLHVILLFSTNWRVSLAAPRFL